MPFIFLLIFIISVVFSIHVATTAPHPSPPKKQIKSDDLTSITKVCFLIGKYTLWAHAAIEIFVITASALVRQFPDSPLVVQTHSILLTSFLLRPAYNAHSEPISFPPIRVLGGLLMIAGSLIRFLCYRELGKHFTFHVAILPKHELITSGPYSIVRHPAYIGGFVWHAGSLLWHGSPGSWLRESRVYERKFSWLVLVPTIFMVSSMIMMGITRMRKEDEMLKEEFGKKWDQWAKIVPYRHIPGVY